MESQPDPQPVVTESDHQGSMIVLKDGVEHKVPITIHKIETRHPDGRMDCRLVVPRLSTKSTTKQ